MDPSDHEKRDLGNGGTQKGEGWLRSVVENSSEIVTVVDPDGTLRYANPAWQQLLGYDPDEAIGTMNVLDHVHPEDLGHVLEETEKALSEGGVATSKAEYRFRRKNGSWRWMESVGTYLLNDPAVGGVVVVSRDVTERKEAEEAFRESERRLSSVVSHAHAYVYRCRNEPGWPNEYASEYALELTGYPPEDLLVGGKVRLGDLIVEGDRKRVWEEVQEALAEGRSFELRYAIRHRDGRTKHVQEYGRGVYDEEGEVVALEGLLYDVTEREQTEERLREAEERYRTLVERVPAIVYVQEPGEPSRTTYISPQNEAILGYAPEECLTDPDHWVKILHSDDRERVLVEDERSNENGDSFAMEYRQFAKDGRMVWVRDEATLVRDEAGEPLYWLGVQTDVTERRMTETRLGEAEARYRSLVERVPVAIYRQEIDHNGAVTYISPQIEAITGYAPEEYEDPTFWVRNMHPDDRQRVLAEDERTDRTGEPFRVEFRKFARDGRLIWLRDEAVLVRDEAGEPLYWQGVVSDITERKTLEEQLQHQAFHDPLTGLPNRSLFMDRLGQALTRTQRRRSGSEVAVLFMDLDGFKVINDSLGHDTGDRLLVAVAERLKGCFRSEDTLARFAGDEFVVLLEEVDGAEDALRGVRRITEEFRGPFALEGREIFVRFSIGVALGEADTKSPEGLLRDADIAMYRAKEDAADYRVFDPGMHQEALNRIDLENDLRLALEKEEFTLHYQPKFRLGQQDGIEGVEALVRWEHPKNGFMLPGEFIPLAEETGLIIPLGIWVVQEACRQVKEWQEHYPNEPPLAVCVNLSARQVRHPGLRNDVRSALRESGLEPNSLILEITEGTLLKDTQLIRTIFRDLKALGVRLTIDDFGKEYSSLSYLTRLPVDALKIDRSFLERFGEDPRNKTVVEAVVTLAHSLGLEVTGEGVERAEQLELLRGMGCDFAQGYYLARPVPSEEVKQLLVNSTTS